MDTMFERYYEISIDNTTYNMQNLNEIIYNIVGTITRNIFTNSNDNQSNFTIEYEIINETKEKKIDQKDINNKLGKYKKIRSIDNLIQSKLSCPICLENYSTKEFKRELKCGHTFHKKCIDKWIKKYNTCPICREKII